MTLEGIDVSKYQAVTPPLAGLDFLFARASIGVRHDTRYAQHALNATTAGLVVGTYHFGYSGGIPAQVAAFLDAAGDVDLYALDVEGPSAPTHLESAAFIKAVQAAGKVCGLYHSASGFFDAGQDFDWVAQWTTASPTRHWAFWQYTSSGHIPGYDGRLDLDRFNGTRADLDKLAGGPMAQLPITSTVPHMVDIPGPVTFYDLDGSVLSTGHSAQTNVYSPYSATPAPDNVFYAIYRGPAPVTLILTKPMAVRPIPPQDCTDEIAAAIEADRAKAKVGVVYE